MHTDIYIYSNSKVNTEDHLTSQLYLTEQNCNVLLFGIVGTLSLPRFHEARDQPEQVVLQRERMHRNRALKRHMGARRNDKQITGPVYSREIFIRPRLFKPGMGGICESHIFSLTSALQPLLMNVQIGWYAPVPQV